MKQYDMNGFPKSMAELIEQFSKFPSIGKKTAQRLAFFVLSQSNDDVTKTAQAMINVKKNPTNMHPTISLCIPFFI